MNAHSAIAAEKELSLNVGQIRATNALKPLKYPSHKVPHATIETNRTCNIRCRSCYTLDRESIKSIADVKNEIDLALQKRTLQAVTILGGEPTLYPGLKDIVAYIKSKRLFCQLLSNGIVLLGDKGDELLDRLVECGLDRILLHVDSGQVHVHKNLDSVRQTLFSKCESKKLHFSLSLTIYSEDQGRMPELLKAYSTYRYFDGILAVLGRDPCQPRVQIAGLGPEYSALRRNLGLDPTAYLPSNLSDADVRWLVYLYFINSKTKKTFACSSRLDRVFRRFFRLLEGRELFAISWNPALSGLSLFLAGLIEAIRCPRRIIELIRVWRNSRWGRAIRFQHLVIQTPPEIYSQNGQLILCHRCPDATIRNGRLTPVCVADQMDPLQAAHDFLSSAAEWSAAVYRHLGENDRIAEG
jgi:hypothetical protein